MGGKAQPARWDASLPTLYLLPLVAYPIPPEAPSLPCTQANTQHPGWPTLYLHRPARQQTSQPTYPIPTLYLTPKPGARPPPSDPSQERPGPPTLYLPYTWGPPKGPTLYLPTGTTVPRGQDLPASLPYTSPPQPASPPPSPRRLLPQPAYPIPLHHHGREDLAEASPPQPTYPIPQLGQRKNASRKETSPRCPPGRPTLYLSPAKNLKASREGQALPTPNTQESSL